MGHHAVKVLLEGQRVYGAYAALVHVKCHVAEVGAGAVFRVLEPDIVGGLAVVL